MRNRLLCLSFIFVFGSLYGGEDVGVVPAVESGGNEECARYSSGRKEGEVGDAGILSLSEVRIGMKGYGLSVFCGTEVVRFYFRVLGVIAGDSAKSRLILARFSGANLEHTGIVAGMSGSPVYVDDKLVGAVSHAYLNSKDPIGLIRPIEEMLPVFEVSREASQSISFAEVQEAGSEEHKSDTAEAFTRLATPLLVSGMHGDVFQFMKRRFESEGFLPVLKNAGGGENKGLAEGITKDLKPGDAVGIPLITGDIHIAAIGTVTYKKGDRVLLFGHPAFFKGPLNMPMSKEYVHAVIPSRDVAFKLSSSLFEVGRVYNDEYSAVAGHLGQTSEVIPVNVKITQGTQTKHYRYSVVNDEALLSNFLAVTIMNSMYHASNATSRTSMKLHFQIRVKNQETQELNTINIHDFFAGGETDKQLINGFAQLDLPVRSVLSNPFVKAEILGVDASIDMSYGTHAAELVHMKVLKTKVRAGDELPLLLTLRTYQGKEFYKKVFIRIPASVGVEELILGVSNAKTAWMIDRVVSASKFIPRSYEQLLSILNYNYRFNDLVVWLEIPKRGMIVEGKKLSDLPSSVLSVLNHDKHLDESVDVTIKSRIQKVYRSNYLIYGTLSAFIKLED